MEREQRLLQILQDVDMDLQHFAHAKVSRPLVLKTRSGYANQKHTFNDICSATSYDCVSHGVEFGRRKEENFNVKCQHQQVDTAWRAGVEGRC